MEFQPQTHPARLVLSKRRPVADRRFSTPGITSSNVDEQWLARSEFERDYDKVIFSKHFRRLNDKAQVVSLVDDDHTHTRLTHSLEVSCVGRSIVRVLTSVEALDPSQCEDLSTIVLTACLAHDIGNPPFGHGGEEAFCQWWKNFSEHLRSPDGVVPDIPDFSHFEGNAIGFTILVELGVTYATILAFTKYPVSAKDVNKSALHHRKNGFFEDDRKFFEEAWNSSRGEQSARDGYPRHPLAYIVEAADDICNFVMDVEDCYRHGMMDEPRAKMTLKQFATNLVGEIRQISELREDAAQKLSARLIQLSESFAIFESDTRIESVRSFVTHFAVLFAALQFAQHRELIFSGAFSSQLITERLVPAEYKTIFFNHPKILKNELKGSVAIEFLMDTFVAAVMWKYLAYAEGVPDSTKQFLEARKLQHKKAFHLLPETTRARLEATFFRPRLFILWVKEAVTAIAFHVFGMTDGHALQVAQSLRL